MNEKLQTQLDTLTKNIESRSQSEKIVVLVLLVAALVLAYLSIAFDPVSADIARIDGQINNIQRQISAQQSAYANMLARSQEDPTLFANERLQAISREIAVLDGEIENLAGDLVTPSEMTQILTSVLSRFSGLELIRFQNQRATPLRTGLPSVSNVTSAVDAVNQVASSNIEGQVFSHGLVLEFKRDFIDTLKYLRFLENVTGSFFWDSISFQQQEWPSARVTLEIHTLSTEEGFIGV